MAGNFFRGTTVDQDGRWGKSDEKLMAKMQKAGKFASILETKIDIKKVNIDIITKWVSEKTIEVLGFEDEIVINLVINMLQSDNLHGKKLQLDVTGFLEKGAGSFVEELWTLLVDAQSQPNGIPEAFIRKKKEEILRRQQAIQMVTNAALQQSSLENNTKIGRWSPHSSATILSKDELHSSDNVEDGRKSGQVVEEDEHVPKDCRDNEKDSMRSGAKDPESRYSIDSGEKEDGLRGENKRAGGSERHPEEERDRNRSHDRRDRDSDHRKHSRRHRESSRDGGRDRERSRERERDRHHRRDSDRSRERSRRSRKDDKSDRGDRKSDKYDRKSEDRSDRRKSHRRERSHSDDRHRSDRKSSHRRDDVRDRRKDHRSSRRDDEEKMDEEDTVKRNQDHKVDVAEDVKVEENEE